MAAVVDVLATEAPGLRPPDWGLQIGESVDRARKRRGFSAEGYKCDPLLTDGLRWRRVIFDRPFLMSDPVMVTVQHMDDSFEVCGGTIDPAKHFIDLGNRIELGTFEETPTMIRLTYWWPDLGTPTGSGDRWRGLRRTPNPCLVHPNGPEFVPARRTRFQLDTGAAAQPVRLPTAVVSQRTIERPELGSDDADLPINAPRRWRGLRPRCPRRRADRRR